MTVKWHYYLPRRFNKLTILKSLVAWMNYWCLPWNWVDWHIDISFAYDLDISVDFDVDISVDCDFYILLIVTLTPLLIMTLTFSRLWRMRRRSVPTLCRRRHSVSRTSMSVTSWTWTHWPITMRSVWPTSSRTATSRREPWDSPGSDLPRVLGHVLFTVSHNVLSLVRLCLCHARDFMLEIWQLS